MALCRLDREWLELVRRLPEAEIPWNHSTVVHAVRVAAQLSDDLAEMHRIVDDLVSRLPSPVVDPNQEELAL